MLHARYNENGSRILCEQANILEIEKSGYSYKDNPKTNAIIAEVAEVSEIIQDYEEVEKAPVKKIRTPRKTPVKKDTKGVVL